MTESSSLLRAMSLFDFAVPIPRWPQAGKPVNQYVRLREIPFFGSVVGREAFGRVGAAWSEEGLAFSFEVSGRTEPLRYSPSQFYSSDSIHLLLTTRPAATGQRAARYMARVALFPGAAFKHRQHVARVESQASQEWQRSQPEENLAFLELNRFDYRIMVSLPANLLVGFDPKAEPRIGFAYLIRDSVWGTQVVGQDNSGQTVTPPETWPILELEA